MKIFMVMPTWNNPVMCGNAIRTLFEYTDFAKYGYLTLVDNSTEKSEELKAICNRYGVKTYEPDTNLGWMKSINRGIRDVTILELFTMCNDDVVFPQDPDFWPRTIELFDDPKVAGVGPVSNYVMGPQYFEFQPPQVVGSVEYLIGFCATYRASVLRGVGPLDESLPGGDDLDLSMRIRARGYTLLVDRRSFLYHYGAVTGNRVHSDWDSLQSQHKTLNALIRKHGIKPWFNMMRGIWTGYATDGVGESLSPELRSRIVEEVYTLGLHVIAGGITIIEGSSPPKELEFLAEQVQGVERVLEIGFNAGMSACAMLVADPDVHVTSVDIGEWPAVALGAEYLALRFGPRINVVIGDSTVALPKLQGRFGFAFVDGGHDYETAYADICNAARVSDKIMVDDLQMAGVAQAWNQAIAEGIVTPIKRYVDSSTAASRYWVLGRSGK